MKKQTSLLVIALLMNTASAVQQPKVGKLSQIKNRSNTKLHARDDECVNDDTVGDEFDDTCTDYYDANPDECGNYDTEEFVAADLCCACMGGAQITEPTIEGPTDVAVDEGPETSAECVDDDSVVDSYGDSCTDWYNFRPETCGDYDTDEFIAT